MNLKVFIFLVFWRKETRKWRKENIEKETKNKKDTTRFFLKKNKKPRKLAESMLKKGIKKEKRRYRDHLM